MSKWKYEETVFYHDPRIGAKTLAQYLTELDNNFGWEIVQIIPDSSTTDRIIVRKEI